LHEYYNSVKPAASIVCSPFVR